MATSKQTLLGVHAFIAGGTPGVFGVNDGGDPTKNVSIIGDTPGTVGRNDQGDPTIVPAAGGRGGEVCGQYVYADVHASSVAAGANGVTKRFDSAGVAARGSAGFVEAVFAQLEQIQRTPCGARLFGTLRELAKTKGREFLVVPEEGESSHAHAMVLPRAYAKGVKVSMLEAPDSKCREEFVGTGEGSDVAIYHNESAVHKDRGVDIPPAIGLAHELVHAMHQASGTLAAGWKDGVWNYERQAAGVDGYDRCNFGRKCAGAVNENCIRAQWDKANGVSLPQRLKYGGEAKGKEPTRSG